MYFHTCQWLSRNRVNSIAIMEMFPFNHCVDVIFFYDDVRTLNKINSLSIYHSWNFCFKTSVECQKLWHSKTQKHTSRGFILILDFKEENAFEYIYSIKVSCSFMLLQWEKNFSRKLWNIVFLCCFNLQKLF